MLGTRLRDRLKLDTLRLSELVQDRAGFLTQLGIALFVALTFLYLRAGQINNDEAWYLYASRAVFQGALPYRDFAFPQMPLLPYVYGISQLPGPSLLLGRVTSILFSGGTLILGLLIARRYGGTSAMAMTALLFGFFTMGIYFDTIVKTYALVSFLLTATLFVLSLDRPGDWKYPLALFFAFAAVLARITAIAFVVPVLLYVFLVAPRRAQALVILVGLAMTAVAAWFLLPDWTVAQWNLFYSHLNHWAGSSWFDQLNDILTNRLSNVAQRFGPLVLLAAASLYVLAREGKRKAWPRDPAPLLASTAGLLLFAASHLVNGRWDPEYLVPAAVSLLPILGIAVARLYAETPWTARPFVQAVLVGVLLLMPLVESTAHIDRTGGRLPLAEVDQVAAVVAQNSTPQDRVMVMEALGVVLEADRQPLPGMTLAQFSLQNMDTATAQQMHVVNYQMVLDALTQKAARVVVLTNQDLTDLAALAPQGSDEIPQILDRNYQLLGTMSEYGQFSNTIGVYVAR